jgi:hypothetical protein
MEVHGLQRRRCSGLLRVGNFAGWPRSQCAEISDKMPTLQAYAPWSVDLLKRWSFDEEEAQDA